GYLEAVRELEMFGALPERACEILHDIDALILKGYGLPSPLGSELLNYFRAYGDKRPVRYQTAQEFRGLQRAKNKSAIRLLDQWMADDSGYDEAVWPDVRKAIEEDRSAARRPFHD
ncbi:MAG: hypothetical protein L0Z53_15410, partial [Acidobacteriales bacterium]|nr:hypothetical protein [Terriglobales bacterium]